MALGAYRFLAGAGFEETERTSKFRWQAQEVIGAPPALQYVGPGEETVEISGTIFTHYRGGIGQVDMMRMQAGLGLPMMLVDGTGRVFGLHVIESVSETRKVFFADGAPRKIEFRISLKKFA